MSRARRLLLGLALGWASMALAAEEAGGPFGYGKSMYVYDDKKGGRLDQHTPGFGGALGYETAEYAGFRLRAAAYLTTDLGLGRDNPRETDAYMFDLDKQPYALLGEARLDYRAGDHRLSLGRQPFQSPIINSYDYRIIPNLFEAARLVGPLGPGLSYTLAYVGAMSGLDGLVTYSEFRPMSQQTYTSLMVDAAGRPDSSTGDTLDPSTVVGDRGVWVAGLVREGEPGYQLWYFHGLDTLDTLYMDGRLGLTRPGAYTARLEGQAYRVGAVGRFDDYLGGLGLDADYALWGARLTLAADPAGHALAFAYNRFTGGADTVTALGNWGGYPEFVGMPYMYAENGGISAVAGGELKKISLLLNLARWGLVDQSLLLGLADIDIDERILAASDIRVATALWRIRLSPRLNGRLALEHRHSRNARYDNAIVTLGLRYDFGGH